MSLAQMMDKTLTILEESQVPDGSGGFYKEWLPIGTIPGAIRQLSANRQDMWMRLGIKATHRIMTEPGAIVKEEHRLQEGARIFRNPKITDPTERGHHWEIICEEVR